MTRKECLDVAAACVLKDRQNEYGGPEDNFGRIALFWSDYLGVKLDGVDVAMMMALLKIARVRNNKSYEDGYIDLAGYAACGAEIAGRAEAYRQSIEAAGEEYKKLRSEAEAQPEFKPGDRVQACYNEERGVWFDGVVEKVKEGHCHIRRPNGEEISAPMKLIRKQPAETETEPQFKRGDKVQYRVTLPSVSDSLWRDATYFRRGFGTTRPHFVYSDEGLVSVKDEDIRPAPKAEGCEDLVCDEARMRESMPGIVPQDGPSDMDAPQTKEDLYQHIVDCNPSVFKAHKPTGEELAEITKEDAHE